MVQAWRHLFDYVQPNLVIFDHSPVAMLASRGLPCRKVTVGTGFEIPPDGFPAPLLRTTAPCSPQQLIDREHGLLATINNVVAERKLLPLTKVTDIFGDLDLCILATFRELDHYPSRSSSAVYYGCWPNQGGAIPEWPLGSRPHIYAYLKPFPNLLFITRLLADSGCSTILCFDGDARTLQRSVGATPTMRITNEPLDLALIGSQCDLAVLTGSHGTTASMLLAGRPIFFLPNHLEQGITAYHVERLKAGVAADRKRTSHIEERWRYFRANLEQLRTAAQMFADQYRAFDPEQRLHDVTRRVLDLVKHSS